MKKSKQILAAFLCAVMALAFIPAISVSASEYSGTCGTNVTWTLDTDTGILTISGTGDMTDYSSYKSVPWYSYRTSITSIEISNGVTSICEYAFYNCSKLTSITIPAGVTSIGGNAFYNCSKLTNVYITDIAAWCNITLSNYASYPLYYADAGNLYLNGEPAEDIIIPNSVTSIGDYAFYKCSNLTSISIPNSVTSIGRAAFSDCAKLTSVTIPNSVTTIDSPSFSRCGNLIIEVDSDNQYYSSVDGVLFNKEQTEIITYSKDVICPEYTIPNSVTEIGNSAFSGCTALTNITIPDSVTSIGTNVFRNCTGLTSITIPTGVTSIGNYAFYGCTALTNITIPAGVTSIGTYAFYGCTGLTSITIPNSVTSIDSYAFENCTSLNEVNYDGSDNDWLSIDIGYGNDYLSGAYGLYSGTCGDDLTWELNTNTGILIISGAGAMKEFYSYSSAPWYSYRESITSVIIEDGVTSIGQYAFYNCKNLTSITIPASVTSINCRYAFWGAHPTSVYITDIAAWCNITFETNLLGPDGDLYLNGELADEIIIPDGVASIRSYAFYNCSSLKSITIPDSITSIGEYAFSNTAYYNDESNWENDVLYIDNHLIAAKTSVSGDYNIKSGTLTIADYAFYNCSNLTSVTIPEGVTSIGDLMFYGCSNLESITIPDGVTSIGNDAFYNCSSLTSVTIPDGVTSIGSYAFYGCTNLESIIIPDSVTSIGEHAFSNTAYYNDDSNWESDVLYIDNHLIKANTTISGSYAITGGTLTIAGAAFESCTKLTGISIPDSIVSIGSNAFSECTKLSSVTYGGSADDWDAIAIGDGNTYLLKAFGIYSGTCGDDVTWTFNSNTGSLTISGTGDMTNYSSYNSMAWYTYRTNITSITITDGVTSIGKYAFYNCSSLTSVTIPGSITSIGSAAFYFCKSLESVYITDLAAWCGISYSGIISNPLNYGGNLYINGELAEEITIPDGVTSIGKYAFYNYSSITSVTIPESVTSIGESAFTLCAGLTSVTIPKSVTNIGSGAFAGCGSLNITAASDNPNYSSVDGVLFNKDQTEIITYAKDVICSEYTIPDSVTSVSSYAFHFCTNLTSVTIPDSVTSIGRYAFSSCTALTSVTIPNGVTSINDYTFYNCTGLTSITIPKSVTSIGESAFEECNSLTDVYYGGTADEWSAITIDSYNTKLRSASKHYTDDSSEITVFNGTCGDNLTWELDTETGILTISGTGAMTDYEYTGENDSPWSNYVDVIKSVTIEDGVTSIGDCAFLDCENLTSVTISDTVTHIGDYAFIYCFSLNNLTLGNNITYIGDSAFEDCDALSSVTIGNGVTYIGSKAFSSTALTSIVLPEGLTTLNNGTFRYCENLKSVTIPRSMTYIEQNAFDDCISLTDIYYNGNENNWECVEIDDTNNDPIFNAIVHYSMADYTEETYYSIGKYEDAAEAEVIIDEDGEVTIDLIIIDETALSAANVTVYAVSYSGGTVESIEELSKTITSDGATFTGSVSSAYKIFIWDENMQPITEKIE